MRYYFMILFGTLLLSVVGCKSVTERMEQYAVHGIDVSHHQARIDWDTIAAQPVDFAFVKATEGRTFADSLFCYNWEEMRRTNIKRGAYHFYRPTVSPLAQAYNFVHWVDMQEGDLPPVLDVEVLDGVSSVALVQGIRRWLHLVEATYQVRPIIYTNLTFYHRHLAGLFENYSIWIARYNTIEPYLEEGNQWVFWQYGNRGLLKGIDGYVDFNVFYGTLDSLEAMGYKPQPRYSDVVDGE